MGRSKKKSKWVAPPQAPRETPAIAAAKARLVDRRAQALQLRRQGLTWAMIAQHLGYEGANRAKADVEKAYREILAPDVEAMRQDALEQLEQWKAHLTLTLYSKKTPISPADARANISVARQLLSDVRELFGLDAPKEVRVKHAILNLTDEAYEKLSIVDIDYILKHGQLPISVQAQALPPPPEPQEPEKH